MDTYSIYGFCVVDTFITVISWIAGFYAIFILVLTIVFSAGGAAQTANSELGIVSMVSTLLFLYLIYIGFSSIFSTNDIEIPSQIKSEKNVSTEHIEVDNIVPTIKMEKEKTVIKGEPHSPKSKIMEEDCQKIFVQNSQNDNITLWILYIFMFLPVPLIVLLFYKKVTRKE